MLTLAFSPSHVIILGRTPSPGISRRQSVISLHERIQQGESDTDAERLMHVNIRQSSSQHHGRFQRRNEVAADSLINDSSKDMPPHLFPLLSLSLSLSNHVLPLCVVF